MKFKRKIFPDTKPLSSFITKNGKALPIHFEREIIQGDGLID